LEARRQELEDQDDETLFAPDKVVTNGDPRQIKALMQAYVREIRVVA
jgi:hypothetical protein